MKKKELVEEVEEKGGLKKDDEGKDVEEVIDYVKDEIKDGEEVSMNGLGVL